MADTAKPLKRKAATPSRPAPPVPGGSFDFAGILAVADMLPVMVAFADRDLRYRS
jgi:hypothetical protein